MTLGLRPIGIGLSRKFKIISPSPSRNGFTSKEYLALREGRVIPGFNNPILTHAFEGYPNVQVLGSSRLEIYGTPEEIQATMGELSRLKPFELIPLNEGGRD